MNEMQSIKTAEVAPEFTIQNLLSIVTEDDGSATLKGAMSPVMAGQELGKFLEIEMLGLARVWFEKERTFQMKNENSGLDTLLLMGRGLLAFFVDKGTGLLPVALQCRGDDEIMYTPVYLKDTELIHPDNRIIEDIFKHIWKDIKIMKPVRK